MASGSFVMITGASRGVGRSSAVSFVKNVNLAKHCFRMCLLSRSEEGLTETKKLVEKAVEETSKISGIDNKTALVTTHVIDLSDLKKLDEELTQIIQDINIGDGCSSGSDDSATGYEKGILINNAASLGHLGPSSDLASLYELQKAIDLNVTSSVWLSSKFAQHFSSNPKTRCTIVNMSSLCAIEPFRTMGTYCAGKAARDMFHSVMAKEFENVNNFVKVLNYAPGMIETEMSAELCQNETLDNEVSAYFREAHENRTMLKPDMTTEKLMDLLEKDEFTSGKHIDYHDLP